MSNQKDWEAMIVASSSKELADLLLACDKFIDSTESPDDLIIGMSKCLSMSAINVQPQEAYIEAVANQAVCAIRFANKMKAMMGDGNDTIN